MNMKNIFLAALSLFLIAGLITSCKKIDHLPDQPALSESEIYIDVTMSDTVSISNGKGPYTMQVSDTSLVNAKIEDNAIIVVGKKVGKSIITITGVDGGQQRLIVRVTDIFVNAKINDTLRFEGGGNISIKNSDTTGYHIYRDNGQLFGSNKYKYGWASANGKNFLFLEFTEDPNTIGVKSNATLFTRANGATPVRVNCNKVEVIKSEAG